MVSRSDRRKLVAAMPWRQCEYRLARCVWANGPSNKQQRREDRDKGNKSPPYMGRLGEDGQEYDEKIARERGLPSRSTTDIESEKLRSSRRQQSPMIKPDDSPVTRFAGSSRSRASPLSPRLQ
ncbi:hypothetical protein VTN00DRAFT_6826 [Thermoascus crustaceus]|uniref:uncharacterized protein n=1 Tax=Thermoascus crustaceus TaxID=5088 RepID=UPI003742E7B1